MALYVPVLAFYGALCPEKQLFTNKYITIMRKIAVLCLLSLFFAGSLSAQVVSDPDQVRDLSVSLKMSLGAIMGNDMDMPTVVGVGAEAEYFHNRKWLIFASAQ